MVRIISEVKFAEWKRAVLQNNYAWKNSAFCSVTTYHPDIASPKEHLYKKMASNPAFIEREVYKEPMLIS